MVLSAYQVGNQLDFNDSKKRSKTARLQQHSMLQEANRGCTSRKAFVSDLITFLLLAGGRGDSILIMGHFNKIFDCKAGMMDVADALFVDLMEVKFKTQKFATHARNESDERIDYAIGSPMMLLSIRQCGYEAFGCNYKGNHRGFFINFDTITLFGTKTHELMTPTKRGMHSKDKKNRVRYMLAKWKELRNHNSILRLKALYEGGERNDEVAEAIDRDWERASDIVDKRYSIRYDEPYTDEVANL